MYEERLEREAMMFSKGDIAKYNAFMTGAKRGKYFALLWKAAQAYEEAKKENHELIIERI